MILSQAVRLKMFSKHYGPRASTKRVKVTYHGTLLGRPTRSNWAAMSHEDYFKWLEAAPSKGLVLEKVEQLND